MRRKPGPRRNLGERERDLVIVSDLYLQGWTQQAIAERVSENYPEGEPISRRQVGYDIQKLLVRWRKEQILNITAAVARELARIDRVEREAWDGWERSKLDAETVTARTRAGRQGQQPTVETFHKTEGQTGDANFLRVIQWCVEQRCKLLGASVDRLDITSGGQALTRRVFVEVVPPDEAEHDLAPD